jgi:hypothetical protein
VVGHGIVAPDDAFVCTQRISRSNAASAATKRLANSPLAATTAERAVKLEAASSSNRNAE